MLVVDSRHHVASLLHLTTCFTHFDLQSSSPSAEDTSVRTPLSCVHPLIPPAAPSLRPIESSSVCTQQKLWSRWWVCGSRSYGGGATHFRSSGDRGELLRRRYARDGLYVPSTAVTPSFPCVLETIMSATAHPPPHQSLSSSFTLSSSHWRTHSVFTYAPPMRVRTCPRTERQACISAAHRGD